MNIDRRGLCLVLSAPSGAGKTAVAAALLARDRQLTRSVSVTTRPPRSGEVDNVDYCFRNEQEFERMRASGELLEAARVFGRHWYGTPRQPVESALRNGVDVVFDIDWQGHRQLQAALPDDVVGVFILPPSLSALDARLRARAGDNPGEIAYRMALARDEISHWQEFAHVVVNDDLGQAVAAVLAVLRAARLVTSRQLGLRRFVAGF
jgi:guanylate kinase